MEKQYNQYVKRAANFAVIVAATLIIAKAFAWWQTGSMAILAAMTDSLVDLFASLTNMLVLRFALQPADDDHTFGHGKAESLAALAQSAFITGSATFLLLQGIQRLTEPQLVQSSELGIAISLFSIVLTAALVWYQKKVVKLTQSPAIEADSLHYQTDLYMNAAILVAMILNIYGVIYADALFAIGIALYILFNAAKMCWEAVQSLLDKALPQEEVDQIWAIALQHPRIIGIHDVKTRRAGAIRFIQLHLELDDHLPLVVAHDITDSLEQKILAVFPHSEVIIHQEPTTIVKQENGLKSG
ncbi:cation diffusion facilitator family transporter [Glaesserella parasuis]|uniref:cation diffusion facilitator family transporter n=1 Tax=Glaesserella parasuis TaxID=738 RepID=UPI0018CB5C90|nr:cation diffusion facilitator family transporter [Glaesserella parasuis]MDG6832362.1 cation diffusion facilitator family transporter [Glaesserella parasuis]MDO9954197.1 cation diffusion facilitator family transporter [Glaesserella parasuis]MDP0179758.1 cation diffusion facilitator family transporter [Glaesserella parasuis]MDP0219702.1 cation diffusion facilitator family transporter [Glaesserella parasuis]MDP0226101.1 cation diffusion facilitator family transporter [Glaesserella parasuis]